MFSLDNKNQLDGSYVPGISLPHENEQTLYFVIKVHLKCPYFKTVGSRDLVLSSCSLAPAFDYPIPTFFLLFSHFNIFEAPTFPLLFHQESFESL